MAPRRTTMKKSLNSIERAFADIERLFGALTRRVRLSERAAGGRAGRSGSPRRAVKITPARRAQLKLQGAYMGFMRQLGPRQKARVKALKEQKGFEAAIKVAKRLAGER